MQFIADNIFFHALGYGILNSLWQMGLLWLCYILLNVPFSFTAAQKYLLAVTIKLVGFIWFVSTIVFFYKQCTNYSNLYTGLTVGYHTSIEQAHTLKQYIAYGLFKIEQLLPYLSIAYLLVIIGLSISLMRQLSNTQRLVTQATIKTPVDLKLFVHQQALLMGIKQKIQLVVSSTIKVPLTIGFLKPLIILPLTGLTQLNAQQLEAVLLHELAHIKRYDYLTNLLLSTIDVILFFNPINKLIKKEINYSRENSCDDWVLQFKYKPALYAEALLLYAKNNLPLAMAATQGSEKLLLYRVRRMLYQQENKKKQYKPLLIFTLLVIGLASFSNLSFKKQNSYNIVHNNNLNGYAQSLSLKAKNPLFNPLYILDNWQDEFEKTNQSDLNNKKTLASNEQKILVNAFSLQASIKNISQNKTAQTVNNQKLTVISKDSLQQNTIVLQPTFVTTSIQLKPVFTVVSDKNILSTDTITVAKNQYKHNRKNLQKTNVEVGKQSSIYGANDVTKDSLIAIAQEYKNYIPSIFKYANNSNLYSIQTTNSTEDNLTKITIKRKIAKEAFLGSKDSTTFKPVKKYHIVVSNIGQPDKVIIVEVLDELNAVDL